MAEFARRRGRARRASRQRRQRASNARHGSPPRDRGRSRSAGCAVRPRVRGRSVASPRRRFRASRRLAAACLLTGPRPLKRLAKATTASAQRSARWRTHPWARRNYSRRDPATRVSACDSADARTTCRTSSAWPRRASFLRARLDGGAPTFFRAYLKWMALRLSLTSSRVPLVSENSKSGKPCSRRKDETCALPFCQAHREVRHRRGARPTPRRLLTRRDTERSASRASRRSFPGRRSHRSPR
jgi:hypothetical protein